MLKQITTKIPSEDEMYLQQQLRFPTPPITPPRVVSLQSTILSNVVHIMGNDLIPPGQQLRTKSVIMRIGHVPKLSHESTDCSYYLNDISNDIASNGNENINENEQHSSSSPSSPSQNNNDFCCNWIDCGRDFDKLDDLAAHITHTHTIASQSDGLYYCRWSGCQRLQRGFNARYKMLVHVRTHTKEKPHQCNLCEKRFSRAENLKIHIRSHSGEKPYICSYQGCNKAYSNSSDRFKHTRTHSIEKPYMCKVNGCQKRYTDPSSLRKHVKTFKHSLQLIKTANIKTITHTEQCLPNYPSIIATTKTKQNSFCLAMKKMCHIQAIENYTINNITCKESIKSNLPSNHYLWQDDKINPNTIFFRNMNQSCTNTNCHHYESLDSPLDSTLTLSTNIFQTKSDKLEPLDLRIKQHMY